MFKQILQSVIIKYSDKTNSQLKFICRQRKIKGFSKKNKKQLIEMLVINEKFSTPIIHDKIVSLPIDTELKVHSHLNDIVNFSMNKLNKLLDDWCLLNDNGCSSGYMRENRGSTIENLVIEIIDEIATKTKINLTAKLGKFDKKNLILPHNIEISKLHQVDIHVYVDDKFTAVIECKSYLDHCYYVRACNDFELFKKFDYNVKTVIFVLEDSIDEKTKRFTDFLNNNVCDDIFYMLDGKRSSSKPIYKKEYKKQAKDENILKFISFIFNLIGC